MDVLDVMAVAVACLFWFGVLVALLRWPGRTLGFAVALLAWTVVAPWAFWAVLGLTVLGAVGRRRCGSGRLLNRRLRIRSADRRSESVVGVSVPSDSVSVEAMTEGVT